MESTNLKELLKAKKAERDSLAVDVEEFEALLTDVFGEFVQSINGQLSWTSGDSDGPNAVVVGFGHHSFSSKNKGWVHKCLLTIDGRFNVYEPPYETNAQTVMDNDDRRYVLDNAPAIFEAYKKQALAEFEKDAAVKGRFDSFKKSVKGGKTS